MKCLSFLIFFLLSFLLHSTFASEFTIDGTSQESLTKSMIEMGNRLNQEDQLRLMEAYMKILIDTDAGRGDAYDKVQKLIGKKLDGMSFDEIILMANELPSNPKIEKAISVFKMNGTSPDYQHDADIVRLKDMKLFGGYLTEYFQKKGVYPYQDQYKTPIYVFLATPEQQQYTKLPPDYPHKEISLKDFFKDMESVLGKSLIIPLDPQKHPDSKPNFYIYKIEGSLFHFAINVHQPFSFARKVSDNYYKIEISNSPNPKQKIHTYEALMDNKAYNEALKEQMLKPVFFKNIRDKQQKEVLTIQSR